jgi:hypothetical protein
MTLCLNRVAIGLLAVALALTCGAARAEPGHEPFRFSRKLVPSGAGPTRVDVDVPLLAGAEPGAGLSDLRITSEDGQEVPYILVPPQKPSQDKWLRGTVAAIPSTSNESGFELDLGRVARIDRLRLEGLPRPLLKQARFEGAGDHAHYTVLATRVTVFDLPDEQLVSLEIPLPDVEERYIRVTWDDRATSPVRRPEVLAREVTPTTAPEPLQAEVPFERRPARAGESRFRVHLPGPGLPLTALELACGGEHLLRPARITEPELKGDEVQAIELGRATLRRSTREGVIASALSVPVSHVQGKELELVVEDGDNAPLDLQHVAAVFAPQPWIYLEARSAAPLVAHYGRAKSVAPRYDLEAARAGLGGVRPILAKWASPSPEPVPPPSSETPPVGLVGAEIELVGFGVSRGILLGEHTAAGLAAIRLDAAALAHSGTLADLRIRDASGHQIPYLLERDDEPTLVPLALERLAANLPEAPHVGPKTSLYRIALPFATLPAGRLVILAGNRTFQRHVTLLAPRREGQSPREPDFATLESRDWIHAESTGPATLAFPFTLRDSLTVYVSVDEGDNEALALTDARLELPGVRLRFFHAADASLNLLYANPQLAAPRYDLALVAPSLAGAVAAELSLAPETSIAPPTPPGREGMSIFWAALVGAVAILLVLMAVLLRRPSRPTA